MRNIFFVLFFSINSISMASDSSECNLAKDVLKNYIKLDTQGGTTHTSKQVDGLVYYNGRDTAAYDSMTIVSSSEIQDCKKKEPGLEFDVTYKVLGELGGNSAKKDLDAVLMSKPKKTTELFYMVKDGQNWKIDSSSIHQPHVGVDAIKKMIK